MTEGYNPNWSRSQAYIEAHRKARNDLDNWPTIEHRKANNFTIGAVCFALSVAILAIWLGVFYGSVASRQSAPQTQINVFKSKGL